MEAIEETEVEEQFEITSPQKQEEETLKIRRKLGAGFINGLGVGFGIGCIAAFIILWVSVYFSPLLPGSVNYSGLLVIFIYPLLYLLALGLVSLTAGFVREHYSKPQDNSTAEQL